jgi:hypothetical protein
MKTQNTTTKIFENEQLGVLEGLFTLNDTNSDDWQTQCLQLYAMADGPMTIEDIIRFAQNTARGKLDETQTIQLVSRMIAPTAWKEQGLVDCDKNDAGVDTFAISEKGLAKLWDKSLSKNSEEALDRYGCVIALNKKLNAPDRVIESHDLYALTLLAILQLNKQSKKIEGTPTEIRKLLVKWVRPTGINAEVTESERKNQNPLNRFERKFTNMFSTHNQIEKDGLIRRREKNGETSWEVTEKGKAHLVKRTLRDHKNLNLLLSANQLADKMGSYVAVMSILGGLRTGAKNQKAFDEVLSHIDGLVQDASLRVGEIKDRLATAKTLGPMTRPFA